MQKDGIWLGDVFERTSEKTRCGQHIHLELVLIDPKEMLALQGVERTCRVTFRASPQFTLDRWLMRWYLSDTW